MTTIKELILIENLKYLAKWYSEHQVTEEEIRKEDITKKVEEFVKKTIKKGELISIQIIGQVVEGKSTLGMYWQEKIMREIGKEMDLEYICADQYMFYRKTMNQELNHVCLLIDEYAALEETGANATLEARYIENFNAVCAQTFIHKIACSPKRVFDQQCKLIFCVEAKDVENKCTYASVYYRLNSPSKGELTQMIGTIKVDVSKIMEEKWYQRYREKKFKRFELLRKNAVFQMRKLSFAKVIMQTYTKLEPYFGIYRPPKDVIETKARNELDREKMQCTILAMEHIKSAVNGLVVQRCATEAAKKKLEREKIEAKRIEIGKILDKMNESLKEDVDKQEEYIRINNEYEAI